MLRDDATHLAAGVSYFAIFSLFPTLLGVMAIAGIVLNSEAAKQDLLQFITHNLPGSKEFISSIVPVVEHNVDTLVAVSIPLGIISLVGILWSATGVLAAINRAVDQAWDIPQHRSFFKAKAMQLVMILVMGIPFVLSTVAASVVTAVSAIAGQKLGTGGWLVSSVGSLTLLAIDWGLILLVFLFAYRFLPNTKTYWRYIWPGAVIATVLYELGRNLFIWYLEDIARYDTVYGPASSVMVFLFWVYLSSLILVLGAEISSEYERVHHEGGGNSGLVT
jgi:membrane protein